MWTSDSRLGGLQKPQFKAVLVTVSRIFCRIFFKTNQVNALSLIKAWICFRDIPQVWHHAPKPKIVKVLSPISPIMNFLNAHIYEQPPKICFRSRKRFISVSSSSQPSKEFHPGQEQRTRESLLLPGKSGGTHLMTQKHPLQSTLAHFNTTIQFLSSCLRTLDKQFSSAGSTVCRSPGQKLTGGPFSRASSHLFNQSSDTSEDSSSPVTLYYTNTLVHFSSNAQR